MEKAISIKICPICKKRVETDLPQHIKDFHAEKEIQDAIFKDKSTGMPDLEIGQKYGVSFHYIEKIIIAREGVNISLLQNRKKIKTLFPKDFQEEQTTVWSFRNRGSWATHSGEYRGNWSPYIPKNIILKYSKPGEIVLDYFCGAGTTATEAKLLGRRCMALDINDQAIKLTKEKINFEIKGEQEIYEPKLKVGDARDLSFLKDNSVDLICAHPPYANIIQYTNNKEEDLSFLDIDEFLKEMAIVAKESFRVLKPGRQCAILIGDTRRKKHVIPLGFKLMDVYLDAGFKLKELIIKRQHNCKTTGFWQANSIKYNFLLLAHEYLPIFEKPKISLSSNLRERGIDYGLVVPVLGEPPIKRKLDEPETTTVWILPEKNLEEHLNKNVIDRYSNTSGYSNITFVSHSNNNANTPLKEKHKYKGLLYIKSPFLNNNPSQSNIAFYLQKTKEIIDRKSSTITKGGFVVIQTQDVRVDGYIEPMAKRIVNILSFDNLWLKEIIIATCEDLNSRTQTPSRDYLKIAHQYLLVYEMRK